MPENLLMDNDVSLLRHYQDIADGNIRYITISPELEGASDVISTALALGIVVGIGHSDATYDEAMESIKMGATVGTHVGNASRLFHQHEPSIFGAIMESDVYCEIICDGIHLAPGSIRMYAKCKGIDRIVAITDSIMATGLPDGNYNLGVNDVVVYNGDAKLKSDGTRAGSTLTMDIALKNMIRWLPHSLEDIVMTLTENPAKEMRLWDRKGSIADGKDADLVLLDHDCNIVHVFARGKQVK
jgi:N-acetylglucosamine-6-phosphate deacetylase